MKFRYVKFFIIGLLSIFLITLPALSQSISYTATVNRFAGSQVGQTLRASTPNQIADRIYTLIKPSRNPLPKITISLGTVNLSKLQSSIRAKGVSAQYYEYIQGVDFSKDPWKLINVSSIQSSSKTYGILIGKNGYLNPKQPISFKLLGMQGGSKKLRFDRSSQTLVDGTEISFTVETGNSGIKIDWLGQYLRAKDSRLRLRVLSDWQIEDIQICKNNPAIQRECTRPPNYSIRLSRS